jgi:signal transduction histidine kinase
MADDARSGARGRTWLGRLWRRATLVQRLAFLALVPTALTALLLVTLLTRHQRDALREMAHSSADAIATQTAAVIAEPLHQRDRRELTRIARSISQLSHVARVQIRAVNGEILANVQNQTPDDELGAPAPLTVVHSVVARRDDGNVVGSVLVDISLTDAIAAQRSALLNALLWLGVSLVAAALISWQQARWISRPLLRLAHAVRQLGLGNREVAVPVTDDTEIGELQRGFNAAAIALDDAQRGLEREIESATLELARKNTALEAASVAKARFLAAATHDLRQPLYALTLFSSALAVDEHDPLRLDRIAHIQECVESLDHLFSELLDLSRLETGTMQTEVSEFPLDELFEGVSRNFRMLAEQHELRLVVRKTDLWVRADRTMLARILNNLVSNALRYTAAGGILVAARQRGSRVRIDVWDTGSGIAPEHQERVFDEFYRVNQQQEHGGNPGRGLGLGLATVQRLAALLETQVELKSRPGRGSLFTFSMPMVTARMTLAPIRRQAEPPLDVSGLRILVVDDEQTILAGIRFLLKSWGCDVRTAEDREQALLIATEWGPAPDLVISDLRLRGNHSGLDVLSALAEHYAGRGCDAAPFARLLITGETRSDRLREIMAVKIPVLYKPVSPEQLRETIVATCAIARADA